MNLLRQESTATDIYLDILLKSTYGIDTNQVESPQSNGFQNADFLSDNGLSITQHSTADTKFGKIAEEKMVTFFEQVLREASDLQPDTGKNTNIDIHRVLELRAPVIVKVHTISSML